MGLRPKPRQRGSTPLETPAGDAVPCTREMGDVWVQGHYGPAGEVMGR
jgi:hypothetical protein